MLYLHLFDFRCISVLEHEIISIKDKNNDTSTATGRTYKITEEESNLANQTLTKEKMPRKHVRSTDKGSWTEEQISEALNCIKKGEKVRAVGRKFGINESTLRRRLKLGITGGPSMGRKAVFTKEEEEEIGYLFLLLTKLFYKVTLIELRRMAFKYAEMKNIKHNFNRQTELAGKDWAMSFMKRNPQLSFHKSEPTLIDRDIPFDETETSLYLNLKTLMEKCNILPSHTSSVDQTDVITDGSNQRRMSC